MRENHWETAFAFNWRFVFRSKGRRKLEKCYVGKGLGIAIAGLTLVTVGAISSMTPAYQCKYDEKIAEKPRMWYDYYDKPCPRQATY